MEDQETAFDVIKKKWASISSSVSLQNQGSVLPVKKVCDSTVTFGETQQTLKGWAVKTITSQAG